MKFIIEGYHYGDLDYGKKADTRDIIGGRGTGHFGTGFYTIGHQEPNSSYAHDPRRQLWEIDLDKYNLYKPKSNSDAYYLHDILKIVNELTKDSFEKYNETELLSILDDYEYYKDNEGIIEFIKEYSPDSLEYDWNLKDAIKHNYWGEVEEYAKDLCSELAGDSRRLDVAVEELSKIFNLDSDYIRRILEYGFKADTDDSLSTYFMKQLGYEGVDVSHLNKDSDGLSGLDNFKYGSVVYDLKPGTYRKLN